ncbi:MAG: WbqC family protein [Thermodesulfobacteriota bacterium]
MKGQVDRSAAAPGGKVVTIHQPDFLPWLGFFDRWRKSDVYIVLDDVQFIRQGWHHRDKIKTKDGPQWLTVPVKKKGRFDQEIREVAIDYQSDWRRKHLDALRHAYRGAPNLDFMLRSLEGIYGQGRQYLIDLNLDLLRWAASILEVHAPWVLASDLRAQGKSTARLVELVQKVGGRVYLTGLGSKDYLEETLFKEARLAVVWQEFEPSVYRQLHGDFIPNLSVLDYLLMNAGLVREAA